jgi:hypothetical protein
MADYLDYLERETKSGRNSRNLHHAIDVPNKKGRWRLVLNVTAPYVPITTDGKEPVRRSDKGHLVQGDGRRFSGSRIDWRRKLSRLNVTFWCNSYEDALADARSRRR